MNAAAAASAAPAKGKSKGIRSPRPELDAEPTQSPTGMIVCYREARGCVAERLPQRADRIGAAHSEFNRVISRWRRSI